MSDLKQAPVKRARGGDLVAFGHGNNRWQIILPEEHTIHDAMEPEYWRDCAAKLMGHDPKNPMGLGDIIEIRSYDKVSYWEFFVVGIGQGYVKVKRMREAVEETPVLPAKCPLRWKWNIGPKAYDVVHADGRVLSSGHKTKADAADWIVDHMKAMAA